jgi:hypothetical protein
LTSEEVKDVSGVDFEAPLITDDPLIPKKEVKSTLKPVGIKYKIDNITKIQNVR